MIEQLGKEIVEHGTISIDSIFRFSEEPTELPAFFEMCKRKKCKVWFESEKLMWNGKVLCSEEDEAEIDGSVFVAGFIAYLTMFQKYSGKHFEYLASISKNEDWFRGEHEPILK